MKANACKIMFCISLIFLVGLSGCGNSSVVYLPPSPLGKTPSVRSDPIFLEQGKCERANLKQGFIKAYLSSATNSDGTCIFNEEKLDTALPHLKQALSDYGNATLTNACNREDKALQAIITIQNRHILVSIHGKSQKGMFKSKYKGTLVPVSIPPRAYEPLTARENVEG